MSIVHRLIFSTKVLLSFFKLNVLVCLLVLFFYGSCQTDIDITEGTAPNENTNTANSETTNSYRRVSMSDGSSDDIIDNNPCSLVILPVSLVANGVGVVINSPTDLSQVEVIFNQSNTDIDTIEFNFPIQVIKYDYSIQEILNQNNLNELITECDQLRLNSNDPVTCVDFTYPLQFSIYNTNLNLFDIIEVNTDIELFSFMENLLPDDIYSANYPLNVFEVGPVNALVNSDSELEQVITNCVN